MQIEQTVIIFMLNGQIPANLPSNVSFPLWGLAIFIIWTITVVALLLTVRIRHLSAGGLVKDFGTPNEESLLWRLFRVHSNLTENLPLYMGVVFLLTVQRASGTTIDVLVVVYIVFRLVHSVIHIAGIDPKFRLLSLVIQLACLLALTVLALF